MAMLSICVPTNISQMLQELEIPGDIAIKDKSDHITVFYFEELEMEDILKMIPVISEAVEKINSFNISVDSYSSFPSKEEVPVICKIKSKELMKMRETIKKVLDKNDIKYSTKFKDYIPHLTIQYNTKKVKDCEFNEIIWPVNNISLYTGDSNNQKLYIEFEFGGDKEKYSSECLNDLSGYFEKLAKL